MKNPFWKLTLCALISLLSTAALGFPVVIEKNLVIRSLDNGRAVIKGSYVLKAGSIIDIPDRFIIRNSIGGVDLTATLLNWRTQDPKNGVYPMLGRNNKVIGQDAFFQLIVLKAAPGSILPKDFSGYVALDFLARSRALKVMEDPPPHEAEANIPVPTPRPERPAEANIPIPTPRPDYESDLPYLGGSGTPPVAPAGGGAAPPAPPSKQEVLQPDTSAGADDIKVFEGSDTVDLPDSIPVPPSRPELNTVAEAISDASEILPGAGSADAVCPDGNCGVAVAGVDSQDKMVCEQISKGNFPENLNSVQLTSSGQKIMDASLQWISRVLKNPAQCKDSCHFPESGLLGWLTSAKHQLNSYCNSIKNCASRCKTSEIQTTWKCTSASKKRNRECSNSCSPYLNINTTHRSDHLKRIFSRISSEIEQHNENYANKMKANDIFNNMDQRLLCLNMRRENVSLDPMARNCSSTAIGIGQVLIGTFYYGFGLANKTQQKNCINIKLKDLASKCSGWDRHAFRKEVYSKYMDYTPKELYEMRTLDVELQARSSYATFLDKLRITRFNLNKAYKSYFGKSDQRAINRIENCVRTGR